MNLKYGKIEIDNIVWIQPNVVSFFSWRDDFFKIPNSEKFDVYLHGSFLYKLLDNVGTPNDIDIILAGNHNIEDIENVIYQGIKIGIEKYGIFIDIRWDDKVNYDPNKDIENNTKNDEIYIHCDKIIVDDKVTRYYQSAIKITDSLYKIKCNTDTDTSIKHKEKIKSGYIYKPPLLINY